MIPFHEYFSNGLKHQLAIFCWFWWWFFTDSISWDQITMKPPHHLGKMFDFRPTTEPANFVRSWQPHKNDSSFHFVGEKGIKVFLGYSVRYAFNYEPGNRVDVWVWIRGRLAVERAFNFKRLLTRTIIASHWIGVLLVDGGNPAPVDRYTTMFYASQVVQDFFHNSIMYSIYRHCGESRWRNATPNRWRSVRDHDKPIRGSG